MTELRPWVWCLPFFGTRCISVLKSPRIQLPQFASQTLMASLSTHDLHCRHYIGH